MATVKLKSSTNKKHTLHIDRRARLTSKDKGLPELIEYDRSMVEFGEEPSQLLIFLELWKKDFFEAILGYFFDSKQRAPCALDFAEHVLKFCSQAENQYASMSNALSVQRQYLIGQATKKQRNLAALYLNEVLDLAYIKHKDEMVIASGFPRYGGARIRSAQAKKGYDIKDPISMMSVLSSINAMEAAHHAVRLGSVKSKSGHYYIFTHKYPPKRLRRLFIDFDMSALYASELAQKAAAFAVAPTSGYANWKAAKRKEKAWQIARMVDVLDAIQAKQPWPPLEATP